MLSEKVRPKLISALVGNENARLDLVRWLKNWKVGSKAVLLMGPPGVGKSTSVYAVGKEFGYTVIEFNASDVRTKAKLNGAIGPMLQNSTIFAGDEKLLVFLDEIDGLSGRADHAGMEFILQFIEGANLPVAMAANVEDDPKLKKIVQKSKLLHFKPIDPDLLHVYLKSIARREQIQISDSAIRQIAVNCRGDARFALNLLQTFSSQVSSSQTDRQFFNDATALDEIFSSSTYEEAISKIRDFDATPFDKVRAFYDSVVTSKSVSDEDRACSLLLISEADILVKAVYANQWWRLLRYLDRYLIIATVGKGLRPSDSSIPWSLRLSIWNDGRVVKEFLKVLPSQYHVGKGQFASYYLPYLAFFFKQRPKMMEEFLQGQQFGDSEKRVILKIGAMKF